MNVKLKNRTSVQGDLNAYVENLAISKELVDAVCNNPVNDAFEACLSELHTKVVGLSSSSAKLIGGVSS